MRSKLGETLLTGFLILVPLYSAPDQGSNFAWPNGAKAAVSLSYDDALNSQLDNAIPALNSYGFRASFYLTLSSETVRMRLEEWRAAASQGHELGNHTLFHPCSASLPDREWVKPWNNLDVITVEELREHILLANTMLHAIDGREERTMTVPCGDLYATGESYLDAVKPEFVAIKARVGGVTPDMATLDPYLVEVAAPVNMSGEDLIAIVKEAAEKGTMANLTFHGIGGDYLSVSTEAHAQLLQYLAENQDIYWVDTFLNIMKYVEGENRSKQNQP
jgi:peptidoglycan/xylan/chitin deacetylase (PgdA/CDA1 family)